MASPHNFGLDKMVDNALFADVKFSFPNIPSVGAPAGSGSEAKAKAGTTPDSGAAAIVYAHKIIIAKHFPVCPLACQYRRFVYLEWLCDCMPV